MNTTTNEKRSNLVPIIMMVILFGMISFVTNLAAPMGQVLKEQFGVSNFQGLLGNAANFIAYAVMGIRGILLQKLGIKTALIAIAIGFWAFSFNSFQGTPPKHLLLGFIYLELLLQVFHVFVEYCGKPNVKYSWRWW